MKKTRYLSILLAAAILTTSLAACSPAETEDSSNPDTNSTSGSQEQSTAKSWKEDTSPVELSVFTDSAYFTEGWEDSPVTSKIQEITGVTLKVDFPATDDSNQKLSMLVAGDDLPDILIMNRTNSMWQEVIPAGKMNDMEELITKYAPGMMDVIDPEIIEINRWQDGKVYYITDYTSTTNYYEKAKQYNRLIGSNQDVFLIRQDYYEAIGSPEINDKDSMTEALIALHEKYPDKITFYPRGTMPNYFGIEPYYVDGKELKHKVFNPAYKEMLLWMNDLAIRGILTKDSFVDDATVGDGKVDQGDVIVAYKVLGDAGTSPADNPNTTYEALGPWTTYKGQYGVNGWLGIGIPKQSENAARAIQFLEYMNTPEGYETYQYGVEGDEFGDVADGPHYKMVDGKPTYFDEFLDARQQDWQGTAIASGIDCAFNLFGFETLYLNWATWTDTSPLYTEMNSLFAPLYEDGTKMLNITFEAGSDALIINTKITSIIDEETVKIIFASTAEEAEQAFESMMSKIEAADVATFNAYITEQYFKE